MCPTCGTQWYDSGLVFDRQANHHATIGPAPPLSPVGWVEVVIPMASDRQTHGRRPVAAQGLSLLGSSGLLATVRDVLVFSSAYIAIIAALEVALVMVVLDLSVSLAPVMVGCVTFTIYAYDRVIDVEADALSAPRRTAFVERHRRTLSALAAISYGVAASIAVVGGPLATALILFPAATWVIYGVDWAPEIVGSVRRLKDVLVVNSLLVAVAWGVTVVLGPLAIADATVTPVAWILVGYFAVGTFVGAEISNARDVTADAASDVATLPGAVGLAATRRILYACLAGGFGLLSVGVWLDQLGLIVTVALSVGLLAMAGVVAGLDRPVDGSTLAICGECARLPSLVLLLLAGGLA